VALRRTDYIRPVRPLLFAFLASITAAGCFRSDVPEPCNLAASGRNLTDFRAEAVDILLVMDNSRSMAPYQDALRREFPRLVRGLVTGDHDEDPSTPKFPPVSSIRVGFVTTDMGEAGLGEFPDDIVEDVCASPRGDAYGDDGRLINIAVGHDSSMNRTGLDCDEDNDGKADSVPPAQLPAFLTFDAPPVEPTAAEVDAFVHRASCYGLPGANGCGIEMPLESLLKSLTPSTSPIRFFSLPGESRDRGRGDDPASNAGWLRPDSVLAVVLLSDEDDCSTDNRHILDWGAAAPFDDPLNPAPGDPSSPYAQNFQRPANTRCVRFAEALNDVERYVDGLLALRDEPGRVVFTSIVGVPSDLVDDVELGEGSDNLDAILAEPRMAYEVIPDEDSVPLSDIRTACIPCPTCAPSELAATPARRIIDTARRLEERGASVLVQSICEPTFENAVERILSTLGTAIAPSCVAIPVRRDASGLVPCQVTQTLPLAERCVDSDDVGLDPVPLRIETDGRETCRLRQLPVSIEDGSPTIASGAGFYLDDFSPEANRCGGEDGRLLVFAGGAGLSTDVETHLDCTYDGPPPETRRDVGSTCEPSDARSCALTEDEVAAALARFGIENRDAVRRPQLLECEPATSTCQLTCSRDADCPVGTACIDGDGSDGSRYFPRCVFASCE